LARLRLPAQRAVGGGKGLYLVRMTKSGSRLLFDRAVRGGLID